MCANAPEAADELITGTFAFKVRLHFIPFWLHNGPNSHQVRAETVPDQGSIGDPLTSGSIACSQVATARDRLRVTVRER